MRRDGWIRRGRLIPEEEFLEEDREVRGVEPNRERGGRKGGVYLKGDFTLLGNAKGNEATRRGGDLEEEPLPKHQL